MKAANFPARKQARQLGAIERMKADPRAIRTKKFRGAGVRPTLA